MPMDSISMCSNTLYVYYGCGKQLEVAVSLNHDVKTIILTPVTKTPKSEPSRLGMTV